MAFDEPGSAIPIILGIIFWSLATGINSSLRRERQESEPDEY